MGKTGMICNMMNYNSISGTKRNTKQHINEGNRMGGEITMIYRRHYQKNINYK